MRLELEREEINEILGSLSNLPYAQVFQLIGKIQQQGQEQMPATEGNENVIRTSK